MSYRIFIAYSGEDDQHANYIYGCLTRIVQFHPYKAESYPYFGTSFKERIKNELKNSFCMVVLLTKSGMNSQWVNQEIGYAVAIQDRSRSGQPHIIPISYSDTANKLKGFFTKDSEDILFMDKYQTFEYVMASIILFIRRHIARGLEEGTLSHKIDCQYCLHPSGLPFEYTSLVPKSDQIRRAIENNRPIFSCRCPQCKRQNHIDIRTFLPYKEE